LMRLIKRINDFVTEPPPDDWDGAWRFDYK
jgi:hypothetical protein